MKRKPHILHLLATEFVGGPEKQVLTHLRYLDRDRFQISVGSYLEGGRPNSFLREAEALGVPTLLLVQHLPMDPRLIADLRRALAERKVDALITHGYKSNVVGYWATRGNIPQAMYVRGWTAESRRVQLYHWMERQVLHRAPLVVTVAESKRSELEGMGITPGAVRVVVNAVEDASLEPLSPGLRQRFRISEDALLVVAAGRLSPEKGHRVLVDAMALSRDRGQNTACVIFGDGPENKALRESIARHGLKDRVILAGFDPGWRGALLEAQALVNPSHSEVMPNVVLEAMIHDCPVIATRVGGVPELLPDPSYGWVVPPDDPGALADAMAELQAADQKQIAGRARERAQCEFTFEAQAERLHALYTELLELGGVA